MLRDFYLKDEDPALEHWLILNKIQRDLHKETYPFEHKTPFRIVAIVTHYTNAFHVSLFDV